MKLIFTAYTKYCGGTFMKIKTIIVCMTALIFITVLIPTILVLPFKEEKVSGKLSEASSTKHQLEETNEPTVSVAVYRSVKKEIEELPLESYVVGVVASEMPAMFELEALKAQALAARTYIVNQMMADEKIGLPEGAMVTDTELHQVYKSNEELKKIWGKDYQWKIEKITEAVKQTSGQILTYEGKPITAQFFSTSNGYTENSEAYWSNAFPYLTSVESPWDKQSPKFFDKKIFTVHQFEQLLGVKISNSKDIGQIIKRTPGKRVAKVMINGKTFTGREIREKLQLQSADFQWSRKENNIIVETKGYGHGVGMSQYGANGMALEGKTYDQIVKYYYKGIEISPSDILLSKFMVKN